MTRVDISDRQIDKFFEGRNPYENYGKPTIVECEGCGGDLIEGDEVIMYLGDAYCNEQCLVECIDCYKVVLGED